MPADSPSPTSDSAAGVIRIRGARTHHLKDLSLDIPRGAFTVVCGVSGSGKSSLVLDTLGAESRRRFMGTLERGAGAESLARPDVDRIEGLPPAVTAGFTARAPGPRATLGTATEVHDGLRTLFARAAIPHCATCGDSVRVVSPERVVEGLLARPEGTKVVLLSPRGVGPEALAGARRDGYVRVRIGGKTVRLDEGDPGPLDASDPVDVVVDRLVVRESSRGRFGESVELALRAGRGVGRAVVTPPGANGDAATTEEAFSDRPFCGRCGTAWPALSPALFSFDGSLGACPTCEGLGTTPRLDPELVLPREERLARVLTRVVGCVPAADRDAVRKRFAKALASSHAVPASRVAELTEAARAKLLGDGTKDGWLAALRRGTRWERFATEETCAACGGGRLAPYPAAARLEGHRIADLLALRADRLRGILEALALPGAEGALARPVRDDVVARLRFLEEVGLGYLAPDRAAASLSGGELRRARLAAACAARMSGLLYLLDEPTAGLHPADRGPLRRRLRGLVEEGNTVVCVEHDPAVLLEADHVVELGPGAGVDGGRILAEGPARRIVAEGKAPIAKALTGARPPPSAGRGASGPRIRVLGTTWRNLKGVDASFPHGALTCVTGVSGAGKSSLVLGVLAPAARSVLLRAPFPKDRLRALEGFTGFDRVSVSDGAPSRHARANPASLLGVLAPIRELFAATVEARARGWGPARFSPNVKGGRCEACEGLGRRAVRLRHLPELAAPCDVCEGRRFSRATCEVRIKGLSIADVLDLPLSRAADVFRDLPAVAAPLRAAVEVGLGYVPLGEPTERLSGGEGLRLRLAAALGREGREKTLYLLDEPCAGLHPADVAHLHGVLARLASRGDAVVAVEHHPDLVRRADHVVDLGPGPAEEGGRVVAEGPPAILAENSASRTGATLR